jgi:hypothetical protein
VTGARSIRAFAAFAAIAAASCDDLRNAPIHAAPAPDSAVATAAAAQFGGFRDLHAQVVLPTCAPRGGVCHNSKQFPDLHTPDNMLAVVGARCNQLTSDPLAIVDLCEGRGDHLELKSGADTGFTSEIGFLRVGAETPPQTVTFVLRDAVPHDGDGSRFALLRQLGSGAPTEADFAGHVTTRAGSREVVLTDLAHLPGAQRPFLLAPYVPGSPDQVQLGDPNRNGVFGADQGGALIRPGDSARSFLVQRIVGVVRPQMPLANGALTDAEVYALECWIEQMSTGGANADGPIDWSRCPTAFDQSGRPL